MPRLPTSAGLPLLSALLIAAGCARPEAPPEKPALVVRVVPLRQGEVAASVPAAGAVRALQVSRVASGAAGIVERFPFREGDFVESGAVLAELRDVTISLELTAAKALARQREQEFAEKAAGYRAEEIAAAEAKHQAADAQAEFAELRAQRADALHGRKAISDEQYDEHRLEARRLRQEAEAAKADAEMKRNGARAEQVAAAEAARDAALEEVRRLEDELGKRKIRAPWAGYLVTEETEVGQWLPEGGVVATLARFDAVEVRVNVEEHQISHVEVGQPIDVVVDALGPEPIAGEVTAVVPRSQWEAGSRSFPVVVRLANEVVAGQPRLKEGMLARMTFRGQATTALLAHKDAIVRTSQGSLVFVLGDDQRVRAVSVTEGMSQDDYIVVEGALAVGDRLVSEGVERLRPYDQVTLAESPAPPAAPIARSDP